MEARSISRQLEENPTWFAEINRFEPEPVDHRGRVRSATEDAFAGSKLMGIIVHSPGEMMDAPGAPGTTRGVRRSAQIEITSRWGCLRRSRLRRSSFLRQDITLPALFFPGLLKAERLL